jgi:dCMP deaminase
MKRPTKDSYYNMIAFTVAMRSTCLKCQYGAIIVSKNDEIIATGYNGAPRGEPNCVETGICQRDRPPENDRERKFGTCVAVHAEQNAMLVASRRDMIGATMYLATTEANKEPEPCNECTKMLKNSGILHVKSGILNATGDEE